MTVALDTSILAYTEGLDDPIRQQLAWTTIGSIRADRLVVPVRVPGELFNILRRKFRLAPDEARGRVDAWRSIAATVDTTASVLATAIDAPEAFQPGTRDAVILGLVPRP